MATIINNPGTGATDSGNGGGSGLIVGIVIAIVVLAVLFMYVLPNMRGANTPDAGMENAGDTVNVQVPKEIDVNVKK